LLHEGQKAIVGVFQILYQQRSFLRDPNLVRKVSTGKIEIGMEAFNLLSVAPGFSEATAFLL